MSTFGKRLNELRFHKRLTQKQVADDLGMTISALSQYENGKRTPKNNILIKLSNYYGVSVDYLLGLEDNPVKSYPVLTTNNHSMASTSDVYVYDASTCDSNTDSDIAQSRTRVLSTINRLPKQKQLEVFTAIELLLDTFTSSN